MSTGAFLVPKRQEGKKKHCRIAVGCPIVGMCCGTRAANGRTERETTSGPYLHGGGARPSPIQLFNADSLVIKHVQSSTLTHTHTDRNDDVERQPETIAAGDNRQRCQTGDDDRRQRKSPQHQRRLSTRIQVAGTPSAIRKGVRLVDEKEKGEKRPSRTVCVQQGDVI